MAQALYGLDEKEKELAEETEEELSASRRGWSGRPAHNFRGGGWRRLTPRFPENHWEVVKIHDFS